MHTEQSQANYGPNGAGKALITVCGCTCAPERVYHAANVWCVGRAYNAATRLLTDYTNTDAQHFQHMASHAYLRVGAYEQVVRSSVIAVKDDNIYLTNSSVGYGPAHNAAFLVYGNEHHHHQSVLNHVLILMRVLCVNALVRCCT